MRGTLTFEQAVYCWMVWCLEAAAAWHLDGETAAATVACRFTFPIPVQLGALEALYNRRLQNCSFAGAIFFDLMYLVCYVLCAATLVLLQRLPRELLLLSVPSWLLGVVIVNLLPPSHRNVWHLPACSMSCSFC